MEGHQAKTCPKCGTPLMDDNFCMGCGIYVDPDSGAAKGKDSVVGYEDSDSFGSFGISPAADPTGILRESGTDNDISTNGQGTIGNGSANIVGNSGSYNANSSSYSANGSSYSASSSSYNANSGSYSDDRSSYNANGSSYNANSGAYNANAASYSAPSNKPSFWVSVLSMVGLAVAVLVCILVVDGLTRQSEQVARYEKSDEDGITVIWKITYKGDQVLSAEQTMEIPTYGLSDETIRLTKNGFEDAGNQKYGAYPSIDYQVTSSSSKIVVTIIFKELDTKAGRMALVKGGTTDMSERVSYISAKNVEKDIISEGFVKR